MVVLSYRVVPALPPSDVLAPLSPAGESADRLELIERNDELLERALASTSTSTFDDSYYVRVDGRFEDGSRERLEGTWSADKSRPNTVVLRNEVIDDAADRQCGPDRIGWNLPS